MRIDAFIEPFIKTGLRYDRDLKKAARRLLKGTSRDALTQQPGFEESEYLEENMRSSVKSCVRGKETAVQMYRKFAAYLEAQGVDLTVQFPPIPVDNSFERLMFIAKYLQSPEARIADLPDLLWVSERTIEGDLARLRGLDDPIQICGHPFIVEDTERSGGQLRFASTAHPLFLTENLTQVLIMLKGLKEMARNPMYRKYAEATACDIWEQLSDYARARIRFVLTDLLPEDLSWYEGLEKEDEDTFYTERRCSVDGNVWLDCLKNEKPFCVEYQEAEGPVIYTNCRFTGKRGRRDQEWTMEIQCDQGRKTLVESRVLRSCYTLEELTNY